MASNAMRATDEIKIPITRKSKVRTILFDAKMFR